LAKVGRICEREWEFRYFLVVGADFCDEGKEGKEEEKRERRRLKYRFHRQKDITIITHSSNSILKPQRDRDGT